MSYNVVRLLILKNCSGKKKELLTGHLLFFVAEVPCQKSKWT